jgi:NAD(P)-dependent dehydrogenase (short-subunit alcohol dehydrogenase family)
MAFGSESVGKPAGAAPLAWIAGVRASAGLGAALARRFARANLHVAVTGRTSERLRAVTGEIAAAGGVATALPGDLSSAADVTRLVRELPSSLLRVAIFNAGGAVWGRPLEIEPEQFEASWRSGAYAGFLFGRAVVPLLLANGGGTLIYTGATASLRGKGPTVAFAAAKAALRSVAQSFAREYAPQGVHVAHVIVDGGIDGERLRSGAPQRAAEAGPDGLLSPEALAEIYLHLHEQHRSAWTHELDARPYKEPF